MEGPEQKGVKRQKAELILFLLRFTTYIQWVIQDRQWNSVVEKFKKQSELLNISEKSHLLYFSTALDVFSVFDVVSFAAFCILYRETVCAI